MTTHSTSDVDVDHTMDPTSPKEIELMEAVSAAVRAQAQAQSQAQSQSQSQAQAQAQQAHAERTETQTEVNLTPTKHTSIPTSAAAVAAPTALLDDVIMSPPKSPQHGTKPRTTTIPSPAISTTTAPSTPAPSLQSVAALLAGLGHSPSVTATPTLVTPGPSTAIMKTVSSSFDTCSYSTLEYHVSDVSGTTCFQCPMCRALMFTLYDWPCVCQQQQPITLGRLRLCKSCLDKTLTDAISATCLGNHTPYITCLCPMCIRNMSPNVITVTPYVETPTPKRTRTRTRVASEVVSDGSTDVIMAAQEGRHARSHSTTEISHDAWKAPMPIPAPPSARRMLPRPSPSTITLSSLVSISPSSASASAGSSPHGSMTSTLSGMQLSSPDGSGSGSMTLDTPTSTSTSTPTRRHPSRNRALSVSSSSAWSPLSGSGAHTPPSFMSLSSLMHATLSRVQSMAKGAGDAGTAHLTHDMIAAAIANATAQAQADVADSTLEPSAPSSPLVTSVPMFHSYPTTGATSALASTPAASVASTSFRSGTSAASAASTSSVASAASATSAASAIATLPKSVSALASARPFHCSYQGCIKFFSKPSALRRHERTHTGDKPFICKAAGCGLRFAERGNLKRHSRVHSGEKPFLCDLCGLSFSRKCHLLQHARTRHRDSLPTFIQENPDSLHPRKAVIKQNKQLEAAVEAQLGKHMIMHTGLRDDDDHAMSDCGPSINIANISTRTRAGSGPARLGGSDPDPATTLASLARTSIR